MSDPQDVERVACARLPTPAGEFKLSPCRDPVDCKDHLAAAMGDLAGAEGVLVRQHSECFTRDVPPSLRCDCREQLYRALRAVAGEGRGVVLYLRQEGRGIGLGDKRLISDLQDRGLDTVDANLALGHQADERDYGTAARIQRQLGPKSIPLLTSNPHKIDALRARGIDVVGRIPLMIDSTAENKVYLETKQNRMARRIHPDPNPTPPVRRLSRDR